MQKFSNTTTNQIEDEEIEEDIKYDGKFDLIQDELDDNNNDEFIESIIGHNTDDYKFDAYIEKLQDIVIEEEFEEMQTNYFEKFYKEFEDREENKLSYTKIFKDYISLTESYIEKNLQQRLPNYKLSDFLKLLESRTDQIDEQLYELLLSFSDFRVFKEMILDYKKRKSGDTQGIFGISILKADLNDKDDF